MKNATSTNGTALERMVDARKRMIEFEQKYARSAMYPHLPLVVDMVEFYPDRERYQRAANELWKASNEYALEQQA